MTRSRLVGLTVALHGIPYILKDSYRQSCSRWRCKEIFMNSDLAGSRHLRSVSQDSRKNSHSNEKLADMVIGVWNCRLQRVRHSAFVLGTLSELECSTSHGLCKWEQIT
ncbi:hypothetical protein TNCV_2582841 [Trichonephila clavipes]|nr:hypothetical protein TNCV_2582841 [Trichonephila clavipes]